MTEWIISGAIIIVVNVLVWAFVFGKILGRTNTRLSNLEKGQHNPTILPECSGMFTEIRERLANLDGKVDTILLMTRETQKNKEKEHIGNIGKFPKEPK